MAPSTRAALFTCVCIPLRLSLALLLALVGDDCSYRCRLFAGAAAMYVAYGFYRQYATTAENVFNAPAKVPWFDRQRMLHATLYGATGIALWSNWPRPWVLLVLDAAAGAALALYNRPWR